MSDEATPTLRIERYADQGRCVGHIDGRVVFVRFALPGELVRISLDEPRNRKDRFWTGEVVEVIEPSEHRTTPIWPAAGPLSTGGGLGGADLVHVDAAGQLAWKSSVITEQMRRMGHVDLSDVPVQRDATDNALSGLHWRTRIDLIADDQGRPSMRRRGSHERVALTTMPLASRALLAVADHEKLWQGEFKPGAQIRVAVPEPRGIDTSTIDNVSLVEAVGDDFAVTVDGDAVAGHTQLRETVSVGAGSWDFGVDANGFWQVHRQAPQVLTNHVMTVLRRIDGSRRSVIWDLYSGSGLFTIPIASTLATTGVFSVEGERSAVANAVRNIADAGLTNVTAQVGDVATALRHVPNALKRPDAVILDPPRAGAKAQVCERIAQSGAPLVVYIACDPTSLARDTAVLTSHGYALEDIAGFDIYPMTHHVETVAVFVRGASSQGTRGRRTSTGRAPRTN